MVIKIIVEPSPHAKEKGLRKGQRYEVLLSGPGHNNNFPGQWFYSVQPPLGKSMYAFYEGEVELIRE